MSEKTLKNILKVFTFLQDKVGLDNSLEEYQEHLDCLIICLHWGRMRSRRLLKALNFQYRRIHFISLT